MRSLFEATFPNPSFEMHKNLQTSVQSLFKSAKITVCESILVWSTSIVNINLKKIGLVDFALALGPLEDNNNIHTDNFSKHLFGFWRAENEYLHKKLKIICFTMTILPFYIL